MSSPENHATSAPIGLFDSGLGGLTVVRQALALLPNESILYLADQAHVPYGGRDLSQIREFATAISRALIEAGCKSVVMACNISTAAALPSVQAAFPEIPILGVISPGAQAAAQLTQNGKIGVLATVGTVRSGAYSASLHSIQPGLKVFEVACPAFVPLVEAGLETTQEAVTAAQEYLAPLIEAGVDTILLGCTHYPFLLSALQKIAPGLLYIDPAEQTLAQLQSLLTARGLLQRPTPNTRRPTLNSHLLTTTGDIELYRKQLKLFLPNSSPNTTVAGAYWRDGKVSFDATESGR